MRCRQCSSPAAIAIRAGLEFHPTCLDCADWWIEERKYPLSEVAIDYYEEAAP